MAAGDICIRRLSTGGTDYNTTGWTDVNYNTSVRQDGIYGGSGTAISCSEAGHYLVTYQVAMEDDNGSNRSETRSRIVVNGSDAAYGDAVGYIRRAGGVDASVQAATTILNLSASDTVGVEVARTDSNTGSGDTISQANLAGICLVKLPDTADFLRIRRTTNQTLNSVAGQNPPVTGSSFNYVTVNFTTQDEVDTAFSHTSGTGAITLDAGLYIIGYQAAFAGSGSVRRNAIARLTLNGSELPGSYSTGYVRQTNGVNNPVCSSAMLIQASANDVVRLEAAIDSEVSPVTDVVLESAHLVMMKLPTNAGEAMLRQSADHDHNSATFDPISFNTQDSIDGVYWGHSGSQLTRQRSGVNEVKDALVLGGFWQVRDAVNSNRKSPETQFRIDGSSIVQYGGVMSHNRGDQSSSGCWTGGAGSAWVWDVNIQTTHYIEMGGRDRATTADNSTSWEAGQTFLHALDIEAAFAGGAGPQTITTTGIASAEAFGSPTLTPGAVTVTATGIASAEAFGTASLSATATVSPTGIASAEAFGSATLTAGSVTVTATGIASQEAFGTATVQAGSVTVTATGIGSAEAFGTPSLSQTSTLSPTGIASAEAFGSPTLTPGTVTVTTTGIASAEAFGTASVQTGAVTVTATGIASGEAFGTPTVLAGAVQVSPQGIASAEAFGTPEVQPGEAFITPPPFGGSILGTPNFLGQVGILAVQIFSEEAFGTPTLSVGAAQLNPTGIASEEAFGTPALQPEALEVSPTGIVSQEAFGTPAIQRGVVIITPTGIASGEAFGTPELLRALRTEPIIWDSDPKVVVQARGRLNVAQATAVQVVQQAESLAIGAVTTTVSIVGQSRVIRGGPRLVRGG